MSENETLNLEEEFIIDEKYPHLATFTLRDGDDYVVFDLIKKLPTNIWETSNFSRAKIGHTTYGRLYESPMSYKKYGRGRATKYCQDKMELLYNIAIYKIHSEKGFIVNLPSILEFLKYNRTNGY